MTNSQVKQAIDETIGRQPLMNEAFVQKVLDGKQHRKKRLPFIQPAIVLLFLFVVGGMLYFMPQSDEQLAVDSEDENMYLAKPEHFNEMSMQNRKDSRTLYVFNNGTLNYMSDTHLFYDKPKPEDEKALPGKIIQGTYTNIQVKTKDNQYFITGDDGFNWTLTRTAPRILVDERGNEYTIPIAFEDMPQISDILVDDEIQTLGIYKIGGIGTFAYTLEEDLDEVNELFNQATVNEEYIRLGIPEYMIDIKYENGNRGRMELMLNEDNDTSYIRKHDIVNNTLTVFKIPKALADHFHQLAEKIEEINNAK